MVPVCLPDFLAGWAARPATLGSFAGGLDADKGDGAFDGVAYDA
jgi:hypothetical protein